MRNNSDYDKIDGDGASAYILPSYDMGPLLENDTYSVHEQQRQKDGQWVTFGTEVHFGGGVAPKDNALNVNQ